MRTIKIGEAEETVISRIEQIRERHKVRFEGVLRGLRIVRKQIPDSKEEAIRAIKNQIDETIKRAEDLNRAIQGIEISKEREGEQFSIAWVEHHDKSGSNYKYGYGKSITNETVSETQFIFALAAWEREVCKRLTLFKEVERNCFDPLCPTLEEIQTYFCENCCFLEINII